jgi:hypothetical protein
MLVDFRQLMDNQEIIGFTLLNLLNPTIITFLLLSFRFFVDYIVEVDDSCFHLNK